jgi:hypothetical protein
MVKMNKLLIMTGAAAAMLAPLTSSADDYQFIISGDPVAAATAGSSEAATLGMALVTSSRTSPTAAASLEARYRTIAKTVGIALRTDKAKGMVLIVR